MPQPGGDFPSPRFGLWRAGEQPGGPTRWQWAGIALRVSVPRWPIRLGFTSRFRASEVWTHLKPRNSWPTEGADAPFPIVDCRNAQNGPRTRHLVTRFSTLRSTIGLNPSDLPRHSSPSSAAITGAAAFGMAGSECAPRRTIILSDAKDPAIRFSAKIIAARDAAGSRPRQGTRR